ncbi:stalk domain-containing protein [Paenibacillus hamazuiensis]|uniref:stalk domain-containing protein n=1 Tax=Paenibacillus hamazuiensis TaxID=2936508 RepID=UPI00200CC5B3|nr:stalk domain-containing protein [Paenibacillus hamazuiensis]
MNKLIAGLVLVCSMVSLHLSAPAPAKAEPLLADDVKVQVNDELVQFPDAEPFVDENSKLQVPVRTMTDKLGYSIDWQKTGEQIKLTIAGKKKTIALTTGDSTAVVDGNKVSLGTQARILNGRVYIPFRFISETMGIRVQWDPDNRIAILNEDGQYHAPAWYAPKYDKIVEAKATAYTGAASENGGRAAVDYFGNPLRIGTISVDPNVIPLGSLVYIEGYSYDGLPQGGMMARALDTGGSIKGNRIDIFVPGTQKKASEFGIQNVKIYVLKK